MSLKNKPFKKKKKKDSIIHTLYVKFKGYNLTRKEDISKHFLSQTYIKSR